MRVAITHERSGIVAGAFLRAGHDAYSNDLEPTYGPNPDRHYAMDCFDFLAQIGRLDFLGMHPDCTYLTNAGIKHLARLEPFAGHTWDAHYKRYIHWGRWDQMVKAAEHFKRCSNAVGEVGRGYVENPIMHCYATEIIGKWATQYVQPWWFGTKQMKATGLLIVGLPPLVSTNNVGPPPTGPERLKWQDVWMCSPGPLRRQKRSETFPAIAEAMVAQWGDSIATGSGLT